MTGGIFNELGNHWILILIGGFGEESFFCHEDIVGHQGTRSLEIFGGNAQKIASFFSWDAASPCGV